MPASVTDIIELKWYEKVKQNAESRLPQSNMSDAIATLAGGIAHQFNNSMTGISGNIELLEIALFKGKDVTNYTKRIKSLVGNMTHLTDQLLAYARGGRYQPESISLNTLVEDFLPLLHHRNNPDIQIDTELDDEVFDIKADFAQLQMVLSALITNSFEAINGAGHICISTKNHTVRSDIACELPGLKQGRYARLSIQDNGKGMDEETKSRMFEPFFSTKFQGRGLSMAAVHGIIRNHGGWILVDSIPDKGTSINILIPAIQVISEDERRSKDKIYGGEGNILVVEDDDMVLDVNCAMLETLGYHVIGARTGIESINIAKTFLNHIDLILLDVELPDMGGEKVYPQINKIRPDTKVVVCSAYDFEGPAQKILTAGAQGFIQKPFSISALSEKLKETIGN